MSKYSSLASLVLDVLILWKSSCVQMHTIIHWSLWNHPSGSDVIPDMRWISENQTFIDYLFNLYTHGQNICFWYPLLEIRIPLNLSVELFGCSYLLMPLHYFFFWLSTDTHIRFLAVLQILRWIIVQLILHIQQPLSSSCDTNWLWWVKSSIVTLVPYFRRCTP